MNVRDSLDFNRLFKLAINDIGIQTKTIFICILALLVFFLIMPFEVTNSSDVYLVILYVSGFMLTSYAFSDLHDHQKAYLSLMLPCSNFERFLSRWFLTSIGYSVVLLAIYFIFILLHFFILLLLFKIGVSHQNVKLMNVFQPDLWISIGKYIIFQSVVLLGAIIFKKHPLIKTALILGCFFIAINIFSMAMSFIFLPHFSISAPTNLRIIIPPITIKGGYFMYWLFAAPVFWYSTYLKITEFELK